MVGVTRGGRGGVGRSAAGRGDRKGLEIQRKPCVSSKRTTNYFPKT